MAEGITARSPLPFFRLRSGTLERIAAISFSARRVVDWFTLSPVINWRLELGTESVWAMGRSVAWG